MTDEWLCHWQAGIVCHFALRGKSAAEVVAIIPLSLTGMIKSLFFLLSSGVYDTWRRQKVST
ncbi:MAG TPA: hypothetical protein ENK35_03885 [Candidatus Tenderia sp.]|nr:hypothetical protein [Candidatus Tenderia sp.]